MPSSPASPPAPTPKLPLAIDVAGVDKRFGDNLAVADLALSVPEGQISVLLGPNGAGKTTAIRLITGALPADAGTIRTLGLDPETDGTEIRRRSGVVSANPSLYERLSGFDNLMYSADLYGVKDKSVIREAAARFGIEGALGRQVGGYSTGMKTRLSLARSILHRPDLLLFDEPTSGLDPESAHAVLALIREMTADGTTVLMCTHLLAEAEGLADRIIVLDSGTNLVSGSQQELAEEFLPKNSVALTAEDDADLEQTAALPYVAEMRRDQDGTRLAVLDDLSYVPSLIDHLTSRGVRLTRVEPRVASLETLYFAVRKEHRESLGITDSGRVPEAEDRQAEEPKKRRRRAA